ncbi:MAG: hypothetical protein HQK55_04705 [Deltaproteobacteria bacterium]|nr:hypothetical protein [Deltaproteobacteria bacterium]
MKDIDKVLGQAAKNRTLLVEEKTPIGADLADIFETLGHEICGNAATAEKALGVIEKTPEPYSYGYPLSRRKRSD